MGGATISGGLYASGTLPNIADRLAETGALEQRVLELERQEQQDAAALEAARARLPPQPEDDENAMPAYLEPWVLSTARSVPTGGVA